jgi:hypothetical protein
VALATTTDLENQNFTRDRFAKSVADWPGFAAGYLAEASIRLKATVGAVIYADAESPAPVDTDRALMLRQAEACLACALLTKAWLARYGSGQGSWSAANSSRATSSDALAGLKTAAAQMVSRYDQILRLYKSTTQAAFVAYEPPED